MTESKEVFFINEKGEKQIVPELQSLGEELHALAEETTKKAKKISERFNIELDTVVRFNVKNPKK